MSEQIAVALVDASSGVAGDMLLGALLDAGAEVGRVRDAVVSLGIPGLDLQLRRVRRAGLSCARLEVAAPAVADRPRLLDDVLGLLATARLSPAARACAGRVFTLLAQAEGRVHGEQPERVHFHEVGAFDALADVVGIAAALDDLGLLGSGASVHCSALAAGSGTVTTTHGQLPVPVPAVVELAAAASLELTGFELRGERSTPTGAAVLAAVAAPGPAPGMRVRSVGTGGGSRDTADRPNVTRVVLGAATAAPSEQHTEPVVQVEATVDDLDPQLWPSVLDAVRAAGAWDCWTVPVIGRRGRPGHVLTALCPTLLREAVVQAALLHTSSLGARWWACSRSVVPRSSVLVHVGPPGRQQPVTVKVARISSDVDTRTPEVADVESAAAALGWPARVVHRAALDQLVIDTVPAAQRAGVVAGQRGKGPGEEGL